MRTFEELVGWAKNALASTHMIEREAARGFLELLGEQPCEMEPPFAEGGRVYVPFGDEPAAEYDPAEARYLAAELLRRADEADAQLDAIVRPAIDRMFGVPAKGRR